MRRSIALSGIFLVAVGSIFLGYGMCHVWVHGVSADESVWNILLPKFEGDLLSLISLSSTVMVLGTIFLLWAYRLEDRPKDRKIRKG